MNLPAALPWLESSLVEPSVLHYPRHAFATTKRQNRVSKSSVLCGSDNIGVKGKTIIEPLATIRGDLSTIELGSYCVIGRGAVLRPAEAEQKLHGRVAYIPMTIGDHVVIEDGAIIEAAAIGECCHIGRSAVVGPRCMISPCCEILENAVMAPNTVTAPFSIWAGKPAVQVGRLPESFQTLWSEHTRMFYKCFQPTPAAAAGATAGGTVAATPLKSGNATTSSASASTPAAAAAGGAAAASSPRTPAPPLPVARHRLQVSTADTPLPATPKAGQ
jgi:dynactin-5